MASSANIAFAPVKLENREIFWRDRYYFFKKKGYILRPRYHPDWQASWKFSTEPYPDRFEDSIIQWKGALLDATQEGKDGRRAVFIKRVDFRTHPHEVRIASRLGSADNRKDGRNHCVPILAVFCDDRDPWYRYIVMPVLRPFDDPNFTSFGEVIEFVNQTLEGLVYMHEQHVAHRDCAAENILMDGSNLYRDGWHPMHPWRAPDGGSLPFSRMRSEAKIAYYFIDFGLSTEFTPEQRERLVTGYLGRILAPEQTTGLPYDPFKLDVYYLGHVYQTKIVDVFRGLEVLGDLAQLMMKPNQKDRPNAHETLMVWKGLQLLPSIPPRWTRLRPTVEEGPIEGIINNTLDLVGMVRASVGL